MVEVAERGRDELAVERVGRAAAGRAASRGGGPRGRAVRPGPPRRRGRSTACTPRRPNRSAACQAATHNRYASVASASGTAGVNTAASPCPVGRAGGRALRPATPPLDRAQSPLQRFAGLRSAAGRLRGCRTPGSGSGVAGCRPNRASSSASGGRRARRAAAGAAGRPPRRPGRGPVRPRGSRRSGAAPARWRSGRAPARRQEDLVRDSGRPAAVDRDLERPGVRPARTPHSRAASGIPCAARSAPSRAASAKSRSVGSLAARTPPARRRAERRRGAGSPPPAAGRSRARPCGRRSTTSSTTRGSAAECPARVGAAIRSVTACLSPLSPGAQRPAPALDPGPIDGQRSAVCLCYRSVTSLRAASAEIPCRPRAPATVTSSRLVAVLVSRCSPPCRPAPRAPPALREVMFVGNNWDGTADVIKSSGDFAKIGRINVIPDKDAAAGGDLPRPDQAGLLPRHPAGPGRGPRPVRRRHVRHAGRHGDGRLPAELRRRGLDRPRAPARINWRFPVSGYRSDHMAVSPDGTRVAVSASTSNTVHVLDIDTGAQLGSFATGDKPHENIFTSDGRYLWNMSIGEVNTDLDAPWLDWHEGRPAHHGRRHHDLPAVRVIDMRQRLDAVGRSDLSDAVRPAVFTPGRVEAVLPGVVLQRLRRVRRRHRPDHPGQDPAEEPGDQRRTAPPGSTTRATTACR